VGREGDGVERCASSQTTDFVCKSDDSATCAAAQVSSAPAPAPSPSSPVRRGRLLEAAQHDGAEAAFALLRGAQAVEERLVERGGGLVEHAWVSKEEKV